MTLCRGPLPKRQVIVWWRESEDKQRTCCRKAGPYHQGLRCRTNLTNEPTRGELLNRTNLTTEPTRGETLGRTNPNTGPTKGEIFSRTNLTTGPTKGEIFSRTNLTKWN